MRIFVTVGSTYFNELIRTIDRLVERGQLKDEVVAQIGSGSFVPKSIGHFRYAPSLDKYYDEADLVITHAAAGTLFKVLEKGKRVIAVTNPRLETFMSRDETQAYSVTKGHWFDVLNRQYGLPMKLEDMGHLVWCNDLFSLGDHIDAIWDMGLRPYHKPRCRIKQQVEALF